MTIKVGDTIPSVTVFTMKEGEVTPVSTDDLFADKRVAFFGVPGAFTPTCSQQHLPGYVQGADGLKAKKLDSIICMAVNDVFVMDAWGREHEVGDDFLMVADGDAALTKAAGLELDLNGKGLGLRCQRFSMIVENGVVKSINIDPAGTFDKSSCEILLSQA